MAPVESAVSRANVSREHREVRALLTLDRVTGLGPRSIAGLLERFGTAEAIVQGHRDLDPSLLPPRARPAFAEGLVTARRSARRTLDEARALGLSVVGIGSPGYPEALLDLGDPPPVLFRSGTPLRDDRVISIVGTRAASAYGKRMAYSIARELAHWGWTVVSGMASGIDAAAHAGALDAGGDTLGVMGTGHRHRYPSQNRRLYDRMHEAGGLWSEFVPSTPPTRVTFPRRNRLVAALGRALIVVEAGARSGALNSAGHALDLGRDVLAVPGRAHDPSAEGCLELLRSGAGVVTGARDVFDALGWLHDRTAPSVPSGGLGAEPVGKALEPSSGSNASVSAQVLRSVRGGARSVDALAAELSLGSDVLQPVLGRLELDGWIQVRPGGVVDVVPKAGAS